MTDLSLRPADRSRYDAVALGEVMLRIDPGDLPLARARSVRLWHGGGEANVAEGLAACFRLRAAVVTALVDDGVGRNLECQLREAGVDVSRIVWFATDRRGRFSTDQKGTLHNGVNFTWAGKGVLPSVTEYYRAHTPIRELAPGDIDWKELFGQGVRWFHTGGIFNLLSPSSSAVALEALVAAGREGTFRSYDLNYRSKVEPDKERARAVNRRTVPHVDFLVGNQSDFDDSLGYVTEKVPGQAPLEEWLAVYAALLRRVARDHPNLKLIGTQLRGAATAGRISWGAVLYDVAADRLHGAPVRADVEIADRTGGGDSFVSGVAAALLDGQDPAAAVQWGAAHGICVQSTPGDTTMVTRRDVEREVKRALAGGGVTALR